MLHPVPGSHLVFCCKGLKGLESVALSGAQLRGGAARPERSGFGESLPRARGGGGVSGIVGTEVPELERWLG